MGAERVLRIAEVMERVGLRRTQLYKLERCGEFPVRLKLGKRASGWLESEITAWIDARAAERKQVNGTT